jgi:hypothetical protein
VEGTLGGGGAIWSEAKLTLIDCRFDSNVVGMPPERPYYIGFPSGERVGGAVWGLFVDMIGCSFKNNRVISRDLNEIVEILVSGDFNESFTYFSPLIWELSTLQPPDRKLSNYHNICYGKYDAVTAFERLNIKDCILIEDF